MNPLTAVDLTPTVDDTQIHYLTVHEVEALASAAVDGEHQALDRVLDVTAAMTGLRQGRADRAALVRRGLGRSAGTCAVLPCARTVRYSQEPQKRAQRPVEHPCGA